jgi:hypothetical protein
MNVLIIGPHPPLKGGISDFNHQLYLHLEEFKNCYLISFDRNYPFFLRNKKKQISSQKKENKLCYNNILDTNYWFSLFINQ